eukprot:1159973-Pelagomonas_calceolata.AAC.11
MFARALPSKQSSGFDYYLSLRYDSLKSTLVFAIPCVDAKDTVCRCWCHAGAPRLTLSHKRCTSPPPLCLRLCRVLTQQQCRHYRHQNSASMADGEG